MEKSEILNDYNSLKNERIFLNKNDKNFFDLSLFLFSSFTLSFSINRSITKSWLSTTKTWWIGRWKLDSSEKKKKNFSFYFIYKNSNLGCDLLGVVRSIRCLFGERRVWGGGAKPFGPYNPSETFNGAIERGIDDGGEHEAKRKLMVWWKWWFLQKSIF